MPTESFIKISLEYGAALDRLKERAQQLGQAMITAQQAADRYGDTPDPRAPNPCREIPLDEYTMSSFGFYGDSDFFTDPYNDIFQRLKNDIESMNIMEVSFHG